MFYPIKPIGKPRMTRADSWKKRPCVLRYWAFKEQVKDSGLVLSDTCKIIFHVQMPPSWSKKRREEFSGKPHQQKPDIDNMLKALFDALYADDAHIWRVDAEKRWAEDTGIEVRHV